MAEYWHVATGTVAPSIPSSITSGVVETSSSCQAEERPSVLPSGGHPPVQSDPQGNTSCARLRTSVFLAGTWQFLECLETLAVMSRRWLRSSINRCELRWMTEAPGGRFQRGVTFDSLRRASALYVSSTSKAVYMRFYAPESQRG